MTEGTLVSKNVTHREKKKQMFSWEHWKTKPAYSWIIQIKVFHGLGSLIIAAHKRSLWV